MYVPYVRALWSEIFSLNGKRLPQQFDGFIVFALHPETVRKIGHDFGHLAMVGSQFVLTNC